MLVVVFWAVVFGGLGAAIASAKGGDGVIGFLLGGCLGPVGLVIAFFLGDIMMALRGDRAGQVAKQIASGTMKKCPRCAEAVLPDAHVCRYCDHEFGAAQP